MSKALKPKPSDKKFQIIAYVLGVVHLIFGATKLIGQASLTKEFTEVWHFPLWFMYFVGVAQVLGAVGLLAACYLIDERRQAYAEGALLYTAGVSI